MVKLKFISFISLFVIILLFPYCNKADQSFLLEIYSPTNNSVYVVGSKINIEFSFISEFEYKNAYVVLFYQNETESIYAKDISNKIGNNGAIINVEYELTDPYMLEGDYNLVIFIYHGSLQSAVSRAIHICNSRELVGSAVITKDTSNVSVWNYDLNNQRTLKKKLHGDYLASAYNNYHSRIGLCPKTKGRFIVWDYINGDTVYSSPLVENYSKSPFTGISSVMSMLN